MLPTKIAKLHHKIANTRKDFHFQTAHDLCDQADMIFVEDIDFRVSAKGFLGKQMLDGGFGQFREILKWVCWKRGKYLGQVDHKYTSQICPNCWTHTGKKELSQRNHYCAECGYETTRDHASARVIQQRGISSVPVDCGERKLSSNKSASPGETPSVYDGRGVLSGILHLDKCRWRNTQSRG
jgi:putative transposase